MSDSDTYFKLLGINLDPLKRSEALNNILETSDGVVKLRGQMSKLLNIMFPRLTTCVWKVRLYNNMTVRSGEEPYVLQY